MNGVRHMRLIVRLAFFGAACALLWPIASWMDGMKWVAEASPFVAICSSIALRHVTLGAVAGFAVAVIVMVRRRWFCRYVCPAGLVFEGASRIGFKKTSWWAKVPVIGRYAALLTFFGALVGYPVLLWMDPLALFSSLFSIRTAVVAGVGAGILILLSFTSGLFWCKRLCPLGATQDLLGSSAALFKSEPKRSVPLRRAFLLAAAGVGMGLVTRRLGAARAENAPLRPPGAVSEELFAGACLRCGNCVRACPSRIIHPDTGQAGIAGLLAPVISYGTEYCLEDCNACTRVCPSGALEQLTLEEKGKYIIGEALVDGSLCLVTLAEKDCDACAQACPYDAVEIHWDEEQYIAYPLIDIDRCNGCGACEVVCPTEYKAIRVWKRID